MESNPPVPIQTFTPRDFDPAGLAVSEIYKLLVGSIAPRPIAFVSTVSAEGIPNLAPFSYFMIGGVNPPSVAISPTSRRSGELKHTLQNIAETGEYVINIVTYAMREQMNVTSIEFPDGVSEWDESGFIPAPSLKVRPARVASSPISLECRLHQIVAHGGGPLSANYVIGEIVAFRIAEEIFDETGAIDPRKVDAVSRLGGDWYARADNAALFELKRPEQKTENRKQKTE